MPTAKTCSFLLFLFSFSTFLHAETGQFKQTFAVSRPVRIDISSGAGNITVHTSDDNLVHVVAVIHARDSAQWGGEKALAKIHNLEANPPIERFGDNNLTIGKITDRDLQRNISIDYEITAPAQTRLTAETGSGDQSIDGLSLPLVVKTASGKIALENISANVHVETASGNVKLHDVRGGIRVQTASGNIYAEGKPASDWHIAAASGSVDLKVPTETSFNLDASTTSGTLGVKLPVSAQVSSPNHLQGKVGSGGVLIDLHTVSGNILID